MIHFGIDPLISEKSRGISRRDALSIGGLSAFGLGLDQLIRADSGQPFSTRLQGFPVGRARSCIVIFLFGGPSQIDLFDMKPAAPLEFRGEFRPISTSVPGIDICEHLPNLARRAHLFQIVRSMHHEHPRHGWGLYYMLTGQKHSRPDLDAPPTPDDFPGIGALVNHVARDTSPIMPPAVTLPRFNRFLDLPNDYAGERGGRIGQSATPWLVKPDSIGNLVPEELRLEVPIAPGRLSERVDLLKSVDRSISKWSDAGESATFDSLQSIARRLVSSSRVRAAFDMAGEPESIKSAYGNHPFGRGLLLARRLVEAGTRLVQVNWHEDGSDVKSPFWDTHKDNFNSLKNKLLPPFDQAFPALLDDLQARGLLDETLVLVMGEFGRTPRIGRVVMNAATDSAGRDHWPGAYSVLIAGAGTKQGAIYGASDKQAAYVTDRPVSPPDLHATVLAALGIDPGMKVQDSRGIPIRISDGTPVSGFFV
jgi:hypothetical protein